MTLSVTASGFPDSITYQWRKNGVVIPGTTTNTLTISSVNIIDVGAYDCRPTNSRGTFNTSTIQLGIRSEALLDNRIKYANCIVIPIHFN